MNTARSTGANNPGGIGPVFDQMKKAEVRATLGTGVCRVAVPHREPASAAYMWLVLFFFVYFGRPTEWFPGGAVLPLAKITGFFALVTFGFSAALSRRGFSRLPRELIYLVLLFGQLCLAAVFSPVWRGGAFRIVVYEFSKAVLITTVIVLTVSSLPRLRRLLFVQAVSSALIVVVALWKGVDFGRRLTGGLKEGLFSDSNDLALITALAIPFCLAFLLRTPSVFRKVVWLLLMMMMAYAVLRTYSRGGLLVLLTALAMSVWEFGIRGRWRHGMLLVILVGTGVLLVGIPTHYGERVMTILDIEKDPTGSAQARKEVLWRSLEVTAEHPLFGVGPGNFQVVSGTWQETHNSYTQLSSEAGVAALILFLMILRRSFYNSREARRLANGQPELLLLAGATRASLTGFLIGAFFLSEAYDCYPYFLVAYAFALHRISRSHGEYQPELTEAKPEASQNENLYGRASNAIPARTTP